MKLSLIAQLCAIVLCIGALPGCGGEKGKRKERYSEKREMPHRKENRSNKKSMNKEYKENNREYNTEK